MQTQCTFDDRRVPLFSVGRSLPKEVLLAAPPPEVRWAPWGRLPCLSLGWAERWRDASCCSQVCRGSALFHAPTFPAEQGQLVRVTRAGSPVRLTTTPPTPPAPPPRTWCCMGRVCVCVRYFCALSTGWDAASTRDLASLGSGDGDVP